MVKAALFRPCVGSIVAIAVGIACFLGAEWTLANVAAALFAVSMSALLLAVLFAERQNYAAALKDSNDRLRLALDGAELGVWSVDLRTGRLESDARDRQINGHDPDAPPNTLAEVRTLVHPDDLPNLDALFSASARTGSSYKAEYRLVAGPGRKPAGQERWVGVKGAVVRGADGRPARLLGITSDITDRKLAEQRLQESERKSRELLGALPAAVYVTDAAGHITYCNQRAVDLWGTKPKLGEDKWCDLCRFYHADGALMALEDCPTQIALKGGRIEQAQDSILERSDGTRVPIIRYPTPFHDGAGVIIGVVSIMMDITERQKTERALAERNQQLALAGKAGLVGSYTYDGKTDRVQVSEGYAAVHGLPEGTTESSRSEWERRVHPEDLARVNALQSQAFQERRREYGVEYRIVCQGEVRWIESRSFISYDGDGVPRIIGVNIDITERKRAEGRQRVLLAELDHRVKNVLATVSAAASQTKNASGSMEEFVTALDGRIRSMAGAHELLSLRRWQGIPIASLVTRELAAYSTSDNVEIDGSEMMLRPDAGQAMAMVLHELATNAAKYGALSTQSGRVSVRWYRKDNGSARFVVEWREIGGPGVETPKRSGYGTSVVRDLIPYELGGKVDLSYAPEGFRCRLEIPFECISSDRGIGLQRFRPPSEGLTPFPTSGLQDRS
jgi:PAS domain S-box-containing protein